MKAGLPDLSCWKQIGARYGVNASTVRRWEDEHRKPRMPVLRPRNGRGVRAYSSQMDRWYKAVFLLPKTKIRRQRALAAT